MLDELETTPDELGATESPSLEDEGEGTAEESTPRVHPLIADYDEARPWAKPFDPEGKTLIEVAVTRRRKNITWLTTLDGLRLLATAFNARLTEPTQWIGLERLIGRDKAAAMPLLKEYAKAQEQRAEYLASLPSEKPRAPGKVDCDNAVLTGKLFVELLASKLERFAVGCAALADDPPEGGWLGYVEREAGGLPTYFLLSTLLPELAQELGVLRQALTQALRKSKRLVTVSVGGRVRAYSARRTPLGRVRFYEIRG